MIDFVKTPFPSHSSRFTANLPSPVARIISVIVFDIKNNLSEL